MVNSYNLYDSEEVPVIKIWLGTEGLQFIQTLTKGEQEACKGVEGLLEHLVKSSKPNMMRPYCLQYCNLNRKCEGTAEEWIGG